MPGVGDNVVIIGKIVFSPLVSRAATRRSEISAASMRLAIGSPEPINQNVSLSTFHPLKGVEATGTAGLGDFDRLTIHNHDGRAFRATGTDACQPVELTPRRVALGYALLDINFCPIGLTAIKARASLRTELGFPGTGSNHIIPLFKKNPWDGRPNCAPYSLRQRWQLCPGEGQATATTHPRSQAANSDRGSWPAQRVCKLRLADTDLAAQLA
jgi:hypothetical protein